MKFPSYISLSICLKINIKINDIRSHDYLIKAQKKNINKEKINKYNGLMKRNFAYKF